MRYKYKKDLALINLQWLICHKTKSLQQKMIYKFAYHSFKPLNGPLSLLLHNS